MVRYYYILFGTLYLREMVYMIWISVLSGVVIGMLILYLYNRYVRQKTNKHLLNHAEDEQRLLRLIESSKDIIYHYEVKPKRKFRYVSPSLDKFLGKGSMKKAYENANACFENIHPDDYHILYKKISGDMDYDQPIIQRWSNKLGEYIWFEEYATPVYENSEMVAIEGIIRNINEKVDLQKDLEYQISHDSLTNIYNRGFFSQSMKIYNTLIDTSVAIIICDLDNLKYMNDTYGHVKGDSLIIAAANVIDKNSSQNTIVARIGGDEFAILLTEIDKTDVEKLLEQMTKDIMEFNKNNLELRINLSMGYSFSQHSIGIMSDLLSEADKNMYLDKRKRKNMI